MSRSLQFQIFLGVYLIAAVVAFAGCGEINKVNGSLDQIGQMNDKMQQMQSDTSAMKDQTGHVSTDSCELYDALRQGDTLASRRNALDKLITVHDEARKISEAGKYFMAFEFQLWSQSCEDTNQLKRDVLMQAAAQEFLREVQDFLPQGEFAPDPAAESDGVQYSDGNLAASVNALAAGLHVLNPKQEYRNLTIAKFPALSMLDVLEQGIAAKKLIDSGKRTVESYPLYVKEVLIQEKAAVALLQARYNIATAIALDGISDIRSGFFTQIKMYLTSWTAQMDRANLAQLQEYQAYIKGAVEIRDFLKANGYTPILNSNLQKVILNMQYKPQSLRSTAQQVEEAKLYQAFQDYAKP